VKSRREHNVEATRAAILATARKHFARYGYSAAEISRIAADARVTTGAIYHHFENKKSLFQAVAEQLEVEILDAVRGVETSDTDPWMRVRAGFERLIDFCAAPDIQRITFIEAPQVIGPEKWREIELRYAYGGTRATLAALMEAGVIKPYPIELLGRTLLALLRETSTEVANAPHDRKVRAKVSAMVADVFAALSAR
jgi:AcrR family transcriptional regulator